MTNKDIDTSALMTLHEFLLEIVFANIFSQNENPTAALERFRNDLLDRIQYAMRAPNTPGDMSLIVQQRTVQFAEKFCGEVSARMSDIAKQ